MDSRKLRYFVEAVELKSLNSAASSLRVSQPALSKAIRALELTLGVKLLERTNEGVTPTPYGTALYAHAKAVVMELQNAQAEIDSLRKREDRQITIGTLATFSGSLIAPAVARLYAQGHHTPPIRVFEKPEIELVPELKRGVFDLVIGPLASSDPIDGLQEITLLQDERRLIVRGNHPLMSAPTVGLADLARYPWILPTSGTLHRPMIEKLFRDQQLAPPRTTVDGPSIDFIIHLLEASDYIVTLSPYAVMRELMIGKLGALPFRLPLLKRTIGITYRHPPGIPSAARNLVRQIEWVSRSLAKAAKSDA
jgi:DNA-binding transcriptional LysR family regulator